MEFLDMPIDKLKGVGAARSKQFSKLNISTVKDLVYFFPRAYEKRGNIKLISVRKTVFFYCFSYFLSIS